MEEADNKRCSNRGQARKAGVDNLVAKKIVKELINNASGPLDQARLRAAAETHSGDWLLAPPITAVGLRMTNETIRIATGMSLGISICETHLCPCGKHAESRGIHGISCRHSTARISRHNMVNDIVWRAIQRAKNPAAKEPPGLQRSDSKRPDGVTLVPWKQGKCLAWDVTMPDTYAQSHLPTTATNVGHAADMSAVSKTQKYQSIIADPPVHTDFNRNSWRVKQSSKRFHQRTWETYHHCHRGSKRDKLYLSANLSGNS